MHATTTPHVDAVRDSVRQFEVLQSALKGYGAIDSEPDGIFQSRIYRAAKGMRPQEPQGVVGWKLYSMPGSVKAAILLSSACRAVINAIEACPISEQVELLEYVQSYCWRVY